MLRLLTNYVLNLCANHVELVKGYLTIVKFKRRELGKSLGTVEEMDLWGQRALRFFFRDLFQSQKLFWRTLTNGIGEIMGLVGTSAKPYPLSSGPYPITFNSGGL